MSLTGPRFVTTLYDYTLANPSDWVVENIVGEGRQTTLDGTEVTDVFYRKYRYVLSWDTMTVEDYNHLMDILEHQVDRGATVTFSWGKFPQASSGVPVFIRLQRRRFTAGKGASDFYSNVELVLTDVTNRQP